MNNSSVTPIGNQPCRANTKQGAAFVVIGGVAADTHGTQNVAGVIADQHATCDGQQVAIGQVAERAEKSRHLLRSARQLAAAKAHVQH